jgi:hypothetical protein
LLAVHGADAVPKKECPAYYARIKKPMDFSIIKKRAAAGAYDEPPPDGTAIEAIAGRPVPGGIDALWEGTVALPSNTS